MSVIPLDFFRENVTRYKKLIRGLLKFIKGGSMK